MVLTVETNAQAQLRACVFAVVDGREGNVYGTGSASCGRSASQYLCDHAASTCQSDADLEQRALKAQQATMTNSQEGEPNHHLSGAVLSMGRAKWYCQ